MFSLNSFPPSFPPLIPAIIRLSIAPFLSFSWFSLLFPPWVSHSNRFVLWSDIFPFFNLYSLYIVKYEGIDLSTLYFADLECIRLYNYRIDLTCEQYEVYFFCFSLSDQLGIRCHFLEGDRVRQGRICIFPSQSFYSLMFFYRWFCSFSISFIPMLFSFGTVSHSPFSVGWSNGQLCLLCQNPVPHRLLLSSRLQARPDLHHLQQSRQPPQRLWGVQHSFRVQDVQLHQRANRGLQGHPQREGQRELQAAHSGWIQRPMVCPPLLSAMSRLIEDLPAATIVYHSDNSEDYHYEDSHPIGYINTDNEQICLFNHISFNVDYHINSNGKAHVVGFQANPSSIPYVERNNRIEQDKQVECQVWFESFPSPSRLSIPMMSSTTLMMSTLRNPPSSTPLAGTFIFRVRPRKEFTGSLWPTLCSWSFSFLYITVPLPLWTRPSLPSSSWEHLLEILLVITPLYVVDGKSECVVSRGTRRSHWRRRLETHSWWCLPQAYLPSIVLCHHWLWCISLGLFFFMD